MSCGTGGVCLPCRTCPSFPKGSEVAPLSRSLDLQVTFGRCGEPHTCSLQVHLCLSRMSEAGCPAGLGAHPMSFLFTPLGLRLTSAQIQPIAPPETGWVAPEETSASLTQHYLGTKIIIEDSSSLCVPKCAGKRWDLRQILGPG